MNFSLIFNSPELTLSCVLACENGRVTNVGEPVDCYRNLNKTNMFSIKSRHGEFKGLVSGYARGIVISAPSFVVGEKARRRIL